MNLKFILLLFLRLFNPYLHSVITKDIVKIAEIPSELAWQWAPLRANMWKSWFDMKDTWISTMDNLHHQVGLEMYQTCNHYNTPDMLTVGQGAMTQGEYRAQFFLWSVLGAPLILGNDIRSIDDWTLSLLSSPEIIEVDQDSQCVQGSQVRVTNGFEIWMKPLSDGTFAAVMLNTLTVTQPVTILMADHLNGGDFWPAQLTKAKFRDIYAGKDLGVFQDSFTATIPPHDAMIVRVTPLNK